MPIFEIDNWHSDGTARRHSMKFVGESWNASRESFCSEHDDRETREMKFVCGNSMNDS
jgi:hypothetical protein